MKQTTMQQFLILRRHLKVVHHVPGRIRLRVAASLFKDFKNINKDMVQRIITAIEGIKDVRTNLLAATVVISYAVKDLEPKWWDTLLHGDENKAIELLEKLMTTKLAPAIEAAGES